MHSSFLVGIGMVYTLEGKLVHEFGKKGSDPGRFDRPGGICVDDDGLVYVADEGKKCVQVFWTFDFGLNYIHFETVIISNIMLLLYYGQKGIV